MSFLGNWKEAFRPIAKHLLQPLPEIYRDEDQDELDCRLATSVLADYASDDVEELVSLLGDADQKQFSVLFPVLKKLEADAVQGLRSVLDKKLEPIWNDVAVDPAWRLVPTSVKQTIHSAQGILDERSAFCQTMPLGQCVEITNSLRQSGYRPVRFRPHAVDDDVQVAAVWTRDSRTWKIADDLSAEQIQAKDQELRQQRIFSVDVSGYVSRDEDGQPASRYVAIWVDSAEEVRDVRMVVGVPVGAERSQHAKSWSKAGFNRVTSSAFLGPDGLEYSSALWSKRRDQKVSTSQKFSGIEPHFTGEIYPGLLLTDLNISRTAEPLSSQQRYAAVWNVSTEFESAELHGLDPDEHLARSHDSHLRVLRGGSFVYPPLNLRSAYGFRDRPLDRYFHAGMRAARTYDLGSTSGHVSSRRATHK